MEGLEIINLAKTDQHRLTRRTEVILRVVLRVVRLTTLRASIHPTIHYFTGVPSCLILERHPTLNLELLCNGKLCDTHCCYDCDPISHKGLRILWLISITPCLCNQINDKGFPSGGRLASRPCCLLHVVRIRCAGQVCTNTNLDRIPHINSIAVSDWRRDGGHYSRAWSSRL